MNNGGLQAVARQFQGAVVMNDGDVLKHVPVNNRLLLCVFDSTGKNRTPIDTSAKFHETRVVFNAEITRAYLGPRTACKEVGPSNKQSAYLRPMAGCTRSQHVFGQFFSVYNKDTYSDAVAKHAAHQATSGLIKGDVRKGILGKFRNRKVHTPIAEDDNGDPFELKAQRKVFGSKPVRDTGTDFHTDEIDTYITAASADTKKYERGHALDLMPVFFPDGTRCTDYNAVRSSTAAIVVMALRADWVNTDLGNISWPNTVELLQLLNVETSSADAKIEAPNFFAMSSKRKADGEGDGNVAAEVVDFVKRRCLETDQGTESE